MPHQHQLMTGSEGGVNFSVQLVRPALHAVFVENVPIRIGYCWGVWLFLPFPARAHRSEQSWNVLCEFGISLLELKFVIGTLRVRIDVAVVRSSCRDHPLTSTADAGEPV
jgi:hypothetical protein